MESLKYQIITLGNGNKYFVYDEFADIDGVFNMIINVDDESNIEIVKQEKKDSKIILNEVLDSKKRNEIINFFKNNNEEIG